ncbi:PadR family transcriptional regulator [Nocardioides nematodiphilus]|uniref:PadR family transcriptional regulator n=1 Tax=Nocardioides nematodiphilus TaxID=2849669 RepID=UPI001CD9C792|nr:PadR family transcriptional regulator [Nocardioides nematodiphilus]MCA1984445.1 PadR family transcriptional regulator [Nocardioides nematodiphilus]
MGVSHVLLGVLADGPAHGYDLKRAHDERFPATKAMPYGQVYSALQRLQRDHLVEIVETVQEGGPERTVYALTDAGRTELASWLEATEPAGPYAADELVRKTVTALWRGTDAADYLQRQRTVHLGRMRELLALQASVSDTTARIAVDHTIFHLDADLRWLEAAAARVADAHQVTHRGEAKA